MIDDRIEPPYRDWTRASILNIAEKLSLPVFDTDQDWAWQYAQPEAIDAYIISLHSSDSDSDVRFTLVDMLIQAFEEESTDLRQDRRWLDLLDYLECDFDLHAWQIWYWANFSVDEPELNMRVAPFMRSLFDKAQRRLAR